MRRAVPGHRRRAARAPGPTRQRVEGEAEITDKERYERIRYLLGDAARHTGRRAARARRHAGRRHRDPGLQRPAWAPAAAAGAGGQLAVSPRPRHRAWPRRARSPSGAGRAPACRARCATSTTSARWRDCLARAADVAGLHLVLVEAAAASRGWARSRSGRSTPRRSLRRRGGASSRSRTAWPGSAAERDAAPDLPPELIEEGLFRAARFGVEARLPDADGALRPVDELLAEALTEARLTPGSSAAPTSSSCCPSSSSAAAALDASAAFYEIAGMDALLRELTLLTGG